MIAWARFCCRIFSLLRRTYGKKVSKRSKILRQKMSYTTVKVSLTMGQKEKLSRSMKKSAPVTLRLTTQQLSGGDRMIVTQTQSKRIEKARKNRTGVDIKLSQTGIRKQVGTGWLSALMPVAKKTVLPLAKKALGPLASGALSGLSSWVTGKILGKGLFSIPQDKIDKLIKYKSYMTEKQRAQLMVRFRQVAV